MNALKLTGLLMLAAGCVLRAQNTKPDTKQFVQQAVNDDLLQIGTITRAGYSTKLTANQGTRLCNGLPRPERAA